MKEKLLDNKDYYPIETSQITYLLLRIDRKAIIYILNRRRRGIINLYILVSEVIDQLAKIYKETNCRKKIRREYDSL